MIITDIKPYDKLLILPKEDLQLLSEILDIFGNDKDITGEDEYLKKQCARVMSRVFKEELNK